MHFVYRLQSLYRGVFTKEALRDTQENPGLASALRSVVSTIFQRDCC